MSHRRVKRSMVRLGGVDPLPEALSRRRRAEARLAASWARAAGLPLAERLRARAVRDGVLEIEPCDERWWGIAEAVAAVLAGRVARSEPGLGIRGFRIVRKGDGRAGSGACRRLAKESDAGAAATHPPEDGEHPPGPSGDVREVARRYLARAAKGSSRPR